MKINAKRVSELVHLRETIHTDGQNTSVCPAATEMTEIAMLYEHDFETDKQNRETVMSTFGSCYNQKE